MRIINSGNKAKYGIDANPKRFLERDTIISRRSLALTGRRLEVLVGTCGRMPWAHFPNPLPVAFLMFTMKHPATAFLCGILCLCSFARADVASDLTKAKIVPDVVNHAPTEKIEIKYDDKSVEFGNELTPTQTHQVPEIHYKHEGGVLYTLVMTDPDVPTRGYLKEFRHWIVGNIPEENVPKGEVLAEYVGPAPPKNSGKHRYVFLVYRQNQGSITFDERRLSSRDGALRKRFSVKKFAEKYNLEGPIAANYFLAEYDDNVPAYHKLLAF